MQKGTGSTDEHVTPIRVGIGGWSFKPWRGVFFPKGLRQAEELAYASRRLTSIEINATFYRTQSPATFRRWFEETPDDFEFAVKGPRYVSAAGRLSETGPRIERFLDSGVLMLGAKLGPILWQLPPTKRFIPDDIEAFLALLPREAEGRALQHVLEVRHLSFRAPGFIELMRRARVPIVYADSDTYPAIADVTGDFVYLRLMRTAEPIATGYDDAALDAWAARIAAFAAGRAPNDLPCVLDGGNEPTNQRACYVYVISGAKVRAPAAAMALIERLNRRPVD